MFSFLKDVAAVFVVLTGVGLQAQSTTQLRTYAASDLSSAQSNPVVPRLIKFSSILKDASSKPLTGTVGVTFALYKEEQGGAPLWLETQNVRLDANGRYTVLLGGMSSDGLPLEIFGSNEARWLGMRIENSPEQPRVLFPSVPYALKAADTAMLGGRQASDYVLAEQLETWTTQMQAAALQSTAGASQSAANHTTSSRTPSSLASPSSSGQSSSGQSVLAVNNYSGADLGAQIQSAENSTDCTVYGCVIDATRATNTNIATAVNLYKPVTLLLGYRTYSVSATITVSSPGVAIKGLDMGVVGAISGTILQWTGASGGGPIVMINSGSHFLTVKNITFDGNALANVCLYVEVLAGSSTKMPLLENLVFQKYRTRGLVLGVDNDVNVSNGQFEHLTAINLRFIGGAGTATATYGILHNAQNSEHSTFLNLYMDSDAFGGTIQEKYHIYNRGGVVKIEGFATTRAAAAAVYSHDSVQVRGWNAEDAILFDSPMGVGFLAPISFRDVLQRGHAYTGNNVIRMNLQPTVGSSSPMTFENLRLEGNLVFAGTNPIYISASNVSFEFASFGDGISYGGPQAQQLVALDPENTRLIVKGNRPAIRFQDQANHTLDLTSDGTSLTVNGPILSTVATGNAPLAVSSTTLVPNLNADEVDGKHAADFAAAVHSHSAADTTTGVLDNARVNFAAPDAIGTTIPAAAIFTGLTVTSGVAPDGGGLKHKRVLTASLPARERSDVSVPWGTPFADTNYTASCTAVDTSPSGPGLVVERVRAVTPGYVLVQVANQSAAAVTGSVNCIAVHD